MSPKNKINLSFVVILLAGILLVVFLILPIYKNIKVNVQELIVQKQKLMSLDEKIRNVEDFKKNHDEIKQQLEKGQGLFINSEAPVEFISFLQQIVQNYHLLIEIVPSEPFETKTEPWLYINFQITIHGSFPNLLRFLEKIESSPYLIEIKSLSIERLTERDLAAEKLSGLSLGDVEANFLINVYAK